MHKVIKIFTAINIKLLLMPPSWGVSADVVHFLPTNLGCKYYTHRWVNTIILLTISQIIKKNKT